MTDVAAQRPAVTLKDSKAGTQWAVPLGDRDRAFECLARARNERCDFLVYLPSEPAADSLHDDPRWDELIPVPGRRNEPYE